MPFNAVTPELMNAAGKAEDAAGQISKMMFVLLDNLEPMKQDFVGAAGDTFDSVKAAVNGDLVQITDALNDVAEGIRSAGRDFDAADAQAQQEVAQAAADAGDIVNRLRGSAR